MPTWEPSNIEFNKPLPDTYSSSTRYSPFTTVKQAYVFSNYKEYSFIVSIRGTKFSVSRNILFNSPIFRLDV